MVSLYKCQFTGPGGCRVEVLKRNEGPSRSIRATLSAQLSHPVFSRPQLQLHQRHVQHVKSMFWYRACQDGKRLQVPFRLMRDAQRASTQQGEKKATWGKRLQVGAILWYCVFIWMESACCLSVDQKPMYSVYLHLVFKSLSKKEKLVNFCTISYGKHVCFNIKYEQINAACSHIQPMNSFIWFYNLVMMPATWARSTFSETLWQCCGKYHGSLKDIQQENSQKCSFKKKSLWLLQPPAFTCPSSRP